MWDLNSELDKNLFEIEKDLLDAEIAGDWQKVIRAVEKLQKLQNN